jgi:hypothetical protein
MKGSHFFVLFWFSCLKIELLAFPLYETKAFLVSYSICLAKGLTFELSLLFIFCIVFTNRFLKNKNKK